MTTLAVPADPPARKSFKEVWLITIGHALTHWYPATFYLLLPLIGNELGLSYVQIGSILSTQALCGAISNIKRKFTGREPCKHLARGESSRYNRRNCKTIDNGCIRKLNEGI